MLTKELSKLPAIRLSFIKPMYAHAVTDLPKGDLWSYEPSLTVIDALRRTSPVALRSGHVGAMDSRTRFRDVASACTKLPPNTLIDGEVVAIDENGRNSFNALQQSRTNAHIQVLAHEDVTHSFQSLRARHCS
jgi:hypothetical protein